MSEPAATPEHEPAAEYATDETLHMVADRLTAYGFDVLVPGEHEAYQLLLTNVRGALCQLELTGAGTMVWNYQPFYGTPVDPITLAGTVMTILGASTRGLRMTRCPGLALKSAVGRALAARGLNVHLKVLYRDDVNYELHSGIEVTNPARPIRGCVQVGNDAAIRWSCALGDPAIDAGIWPVDVVRVIAQALAGCDS